MQSQTNLVFGPDLALSRFGMLQCTEEFVTLLRSKSEIRVEGTNDDRVQFASESTTFKMVRINLPTSMLLSTPTGLILKEADGYLAVQTCKPDYKVIFEGLQRYAISELDYQLHTQNIDSIVEQKGQRTAELAQLYKISPTELLEFMQLAGYVQVEGRWLVLSQKLSNSVFHHTLTYLTEKALVGKPFHPQEVRTAIQLVVHDAVFQSVMDRFRVAKHPEGYVVSIPSIVRFVLSEMAVIKKEFLKSEFDSILSKLLNLYLPANVDRPKDFPQIAEYFLEVRQNGVVYVSYNPLQLPPTASELVQLLSKIKLRYSYEQATNLFRHIYRGKNIEEALIKYFRKYSKDYELKAVLAL